MPTVTEKDVDGAVRRIGGSSGVGVGLSTREVQRKVEDQQSGTSFVRHGLFSTSSSNEQATSSLTTDCNLRAATEDPGMKEAPGGVRGLLRLLEEEDVMGGSLERDAVLFTLTRHSLAGSPQVLYGLSSLASSGSDDASALRNSSSRLRGDER